MKITLRRAAPEDAEAIRRIYAHYIQNTEITFSEVEKPASAHRAFLEGTIATYPYFAAELDGQFAGFACAEPVRPQSGYRYCVELTIYLAPDAPKRSGIGAALYEKLLDTLTRQGFAVAYAVISGTNEASLSFHRRFGFTQAARFDKCGYKHGKWLDAVWMQKTLNEYTGVPREIIPFSDMP